MYLASPIVLDLGVAFAVSTPELFNAQKSFVSKVLNYFTISPNQTHLGVIQYGRESQIKSSFSEILNDAQAKQLISDSTPQVSGNNLMAALRDARNKLFTTANAARPNVAKSLLIFNTKETGVGLDDYKSEVDGLRNVGVKVVIIGLTPSVNKNELKSINTTVHSLFYSKDVSGLTSIIEPVVQQLLPGESLF